MTPLSIEIQMSILLFVALAGYLLASRINQSIVIGEILVGLLIGPSILGLITYTDFVKSLAQLGAIILLFVIGLEFDLKDVFKFKYSLIALIGVIIPWISGYLLSLLFGYSIASSMFIGTALTATSIAITANVLKEMGKLKTEAAKAIIGAAVIDDILSLLILSVSIQLTSNAFSISSILFIVLKAILFLVLGIFIGYSLINKIILKVDNLPISQKFPDFVFIFVIMIAFFYATIAELIHLSGIVGAFIAGISLSRVNLRNSKDHKTGAEYLYIIFASIFFVSLGIIVDLKSLTFSSIWFLIFLIVIAIMSKLIGCYIPSRIQGMSHKDSLIIGFGMVPRGEVAMIIGLLALNSAIIKQDLYVVLVIMSLITTMFTPPVLKKLFKYEEKKVHISKQFGRFLR